MITGVVAPGPAAILRQLMDKVVSVRFRVIMSTIPMDMVPS